MTVTTSSLTRAAAVAATAAGAIYVGVQVGHPPMDVTSVDTISWVVRDAAKAVMAALALVGITGMYLRQVRSVGVLGLIGYGLYALGYLLMFSVEVIATVVLPRLAGPEAQYVDDVLVSAAGGSPVGDIGGLQVVLGLMGLGYIGGAVLFGIALLRAGLLARWACVLLSLGGIGTAALAVLPEAFNRPMAVPVGVALIGLGVSLWRVTRPETQVTDAPSPARAVVAR